MKTSISHYLFITLMLFSLQAFTRQKMQSLEELINKTDPAWPLVRSWIDSAKNKAEVLPADTAKAREALFHTQISTYATLGAVIYQTGGILIDKGWLRILGSGSERLPRSVPEWNKGKGLPGYGEKPSYLLVADDAVGGFFAINYGAFGEDLKNLYYLAPNSLKWEPLGLGYTEFIRFCLDSDLSEFYKGLRWATWDKFIANLDGSKSYSFRPYLWTEGGMDIEKCSRKLVSTEELFKFNLGKQKELHPDSPVEKQ